jgi:NAD(P)-dependent dehydrogenase (short-subunit alcohol dehydrogenase family)
LKDHRLFAAGQEKMTKTTRDRDPADSGPPAPGRWLVTGANRGIGLAFVRELVRRGQRVVATARDLGKAGELAETGARVEILDVASPESVSALAKTLAGEPLDVLINNAGLGGGADSIRRLDFEKLRELFDVNSAGPMRVAAAMMPSLERGRRRTIVSLTSGLGSISQNNGGWYEYRASKAALNMLSRTLAAELASERFICVALSPGWVKTDMGGAGATLSPQESVRSMLRVIDRLTPQDSGGFFDHRGREVPW